MKRTTFVLLAIALVTGVVLPAQASFHLMQIEQITVDVNGDPSAQAIQLRMRSAFQGLVQNGRVVAHDAAGANPIVIVNMGSSVPNDAQGDRVLIASSSFELGCGFAPDFPMTSLVPPSYFNAGSLTFENNAGTLILWRVSWGGAAYTGATTGSATNDADGQFGPSFPLSLPGGAPDALVFQGPAGALSTSNAADYLIGGPATWTNNAGLSCTSPPVDAPDVAPPTLSRIRLSVPSPNPFRAAASLRLDLPRDALVDVDVHDVSGRLVRSLVAGRALAPGQHVLSWDGRDGLGARAADGIYFFRLEADGVAHTVQGVLMR